MEKSKSQRAKKIAKTVVCVLLFIILLPFIAIYFLVKVIKKKSKYKKWESRGLRDKRLILSTKIEDIGAMEHYQFVDYLKWLFFYDGFKAVITNDFGADLMIEKGEDKILVFAKTIKEKISAKVINKIIEVKSKQSDCSLMLIASYELSPEAREFAEKNYILVYTLNDLSLLDERVKNKIKSNVSESELIDKMDKDIEQKYPFMI